LIGEAFTDFAQVPLVCDLKTTARVLGRSVSSIERDLADNAMTPAPMPRRRGSRGAKWQWSKAALQRYLEGGYANFNVVRRRA